jgi:hypothetical protein
MAGGILVLAMIRTTGPGFVGPAEGVAKVIMIETAHPTGTAQVSFERAEKPVRCEVRIHTSDTPRQENRAPASWCIIAKQASSMETRRSSPDSSDVLCLF